MQKETPTTDVYTLSRRDGLPMIGGLKRGDTKDSLSFSFTLSYGGARKEVLVTNTATGSRPKSGAVTRKNVITNTATDSRPKSDAVRREKTCTRN